VAEGILLVTYYITTAVTLRYVKSTTARNHINR